MENMPGYDPTKRIFYQFSIVYGYYARCLASLYGPIYKLSIIDWKVMAVLGVHAPMSATEAGRLTSLRPHNVTRAVDSLVAKKLVVRRRDMADKRRVVISLSAKGDNAFKEIDKVRYTIEAEMLAFLLPAEHRELGRILAKIEQRCDELFHEDWSGRQFIAKRQPQRQVSKQRAGTV
jgi:DNA-binding MarR family transcriptional regulator